MKELEKTKRISIASILFILVILIGLLTYKKPKFLYSVTPQVALENIVNNSFLINLNNLPTENVAIIDIRSPFEFQKGHIENAINMPAPEILSNENTELLNQFQKQQKTIVLYGSNPNEALSPYMVLSQIGYNNLNLLSIETSYFENKLITTAIDIEKPIADIAAFINESAKNSENASNQNEITPPAKKVITIQKKKKSAVEGGC